MGATANTKHTLAAQVAATNGTVDIAYPAGFNQAALTGSTGGRLTVNDGALGTLSQTAGGFSASFGASLITITNLTAVAWPAGSVLNVSFGGGVPRKGSYNLTIGTEATQAKAGNA